MKRLGVFLLPPGWDAIYTPGWRETLWEFSVLAQEHNTMSLARARTKSTWSWDERINHEAIVLSFQLHVFLLPGVHTSRKKGVRYFCTFNCFNTVAQLPFPSLQQISTSFPTHAFPKCPLLSSTSFPPRKAAIIFCCQLHVIMHSTGCPVQYWGITLKSNFQFQPVQRSWLKDCTFKLILALN